MTSRADHFDISTLVSLYFRALDEREFREGWARACFTDDVRTETRAARCLSSLCGRCRTCAA
ncbi:hypothetical protein ABZY02_10740 [Streptomyces sp. NPDC006649]|uniref:hypothetical protein n=1 Tax=Streptomyces sp. NPDC006649 TaxID=3156896 RepID=UPI0033ABF8DF